MDNEFEENFLKRKPPLFTIYIVPHTDVLVKYKLSKGGLIYFSIKFLIKYVKPSNIAIDSGTNINANPTQNSKIIIIGLSKIIIMYILSKLF